MRSRALHLCAVRLVLLACLGAPGCGADTILTPNTGGQGGGTAVRAEGDDFRGHGGLVVYFGDNAAKAIVIESRWLVTLVTPQADTVGTVDVHMRFSDGTTIDLPGAFTYEEQPGIVLQPEIGG